jgi:hypothetical protein
LGKALQFDTGAQKDQISVYSVFGCRLTGCSSSGTLPVTLADAKPTPQTGGGSGIPLTETFSLNPAYVTSITANSPYTDSRLVGFFSSFNTEQSSLQNGSSDLTISEFKFNGGGSATNCLQLIGGCSSPQPLTNYKVCLSDGHRTAEIIISSSNGVGAETTLQYVSC